jgi:hypothetical protein
MRKNGLKNMLIHNLEKDEKVEKVLNIKIPAVLRQNVAVARFVRMYK